MIRFSVCMPYHNAPEMYALHQRTAVHLPRFIRDEIEYVICDDASAEPCPAPMVWRGLHAVPFSVYRIPPPHIPWSHRCATNIAARHALGKWLIITDMDHLIDEGAWRHLFMLDADVLKEDTIYSFGRQEVSGAYKQPHPDSWLMTAAMWDKIGGYDTRYRGHYGQNGPFIDRVNDSARRDTLFGCRLTRIDRKLVADASMPDDYPRKSNEARAAIAELRARFHAEGTYYQRSAIVPHEKLYP